MRTGMLWILAFILQVSLVYGFTNPIRPSGPDPFMVYDKGYYYLMVTTGSDLQIVRAPTLAEMKNATSKRIWKDDTPSRCCNVWAPEIHWQAQENAWYVYYSASTADTVDNARVHALRGSTSDIWTSEWSYAGRIVPPNRDAYAIDATVMNLNSKRYIIYSSWDGPNQCLYIAEMLNATTVGNTTKIATPQYDWEKVGLNINEGPASLQHGDRTFVVYSASYCKGTGYALGRLDLTGTDPLNPASWTKQDKPIFTSANGSYQPGHNGFFKSPSGHQDWIVYHANPTTPGGCDGTRRTQAQPFGWNPDGTPNLGSPLPLSQDIPEPV